MVRKRLLLLCSLLLVCATTQFTSAEDKTNGKRKVLFLAGKPSHGYGAHDHLAGCMLLSKSLGESGLPIESKVYHYDWPTDEKVFDGVDCVVMYGDGGPGHMVNAHLDKMDALAKKGVGIVCLHYAVEVPKGPAGDKLLDWIGGYFETNWSVNPHWLAKFAKLPDRSSRHCRPRNHSLAPTIRTPAIRPFAPQSLAARSNTWRGPRNAKMAAEASASPAPISIGIGPTRTSASSY